MPRVALLFAMCMVTSMAFPYDFDFSNSDLDFNSILSDGSNSDVSLDNQLFTSPDPSDQIYADINMASQTPLDEADLDGKLGTYGPFDSSEEFSNMGSDNPLGSPESSSNMLFDYGSSSPDTNLAVLDPELQSLQHAADCEESKSLYCCDPTKEFFPSAVEGCIYCTKAACSRISPCSSFASTPFRCLLVTKRAKNLTFLVVNPDMPAKCASNNLYCCKWYWEVSRLRLQI